MRIAVVGLGGVGGYIASYLSRSSHEVVGFARSKHLEVIKRDGICVMERDASKKTVTTTSKLDARELGEADGYFDIVLFCTKSYDLEVAYKEINQYTDSKTIILSFSNGVNNGDVLKKLGNNIVLDACIYILSNIRQSGVIKKNGDVFTAVFGGEANATKTLKDIFESVNLRVKTPVDIKTALYKKYIFISAFASLTTYFDESIVQVCESHLLEARAVLHEIAFVASAKGIDIADEIDLSIITARSLPYDASTSMHLDYKNKKKMELESLCAYVVKEGNKYNVKTPLMKMIYTSLV